MDCWQFVLEATACNPVGKYAVNLSRPQYVGFGVCIEDYCLTVEVQQRVNRWQSVATRVGNDCVQGVQTM